MTESEQPNPGSDQAREQGCLCPVMDNARGRGAWGSEGKDAIFFIRPDCPLHAVTTKPNPFDIDTATC